MHHYRGGCDFEVYKDCEERFLRHTVKDTVVWKWKKEVIRKSSNVLNKLGFIWTVIFPAAVLRNYKIDWSKKIQNTFFLWLNMFPITPSYEKTVLGPKQPVSGIKFSCRFSPRLSENNYSRVMFIATFGPTASDFGKDILTIFGQRLDSGDHTFRDGLDLTCPSFRGLNSDDFPFFNFLDCTSRTWVIPV